MKSETESIELKRKVPREHFTIKYSWPFLVICEEIMYLQRGFTA